MADIVNPIGFLQEVCQKYKTSAFPVYREMGSSGMDHCREFICQCDFDGYSVSAKSHQKKLAKTNAARAMIILLEEKHYFEKLPLNLNNNSALCLHQNIPENNEIKGIGKNPISALQEYCQKSRCHLPHYFESNTGTGNDFVYECKVNDKTTYGHGSTKKSAKTESATKMCIELGVFFVKEETEKDIEIMHSDKNPISALQELCTKHNTVSGPVYEDKKPIMNYFVVGCSVGTVHAEGMDHTKKGAKMLAAGKVLNILTRDGIPVKSGLEKIKILSNDEQDSGFEDNLFLGNSIRAIIPKLEELSLSDDDDDDNKTEESELPGQAGTLESMNLEDSVIEVEPTTVSPKPEPEDVLESRSETHEEYSAIRKLESSEDGLGLLSAFGDVVLHSSNAYSSNLLLKLQGRKVSISGIIEKPVSEGNVSSLNCHVYKIEVENVVKNSAHAVKTPTSEQLLKWAQKDRSQ